MERAENQKGSCFQKKNLDHSNAAFHKWQVQLTTEKCTATLNNKEQEGTAVVMGHAVLIKRGCSSFC